MGRLGGAELGYGCDADVLFVCEPDGRGAADHEAVQYATTVAETVRRRLGAPSPDPALRRRRRPASGGPAGRRWCARWPPTAAYYARWSEAWEAQALLRARSSRATPTSGAGSSS